MIPLSWRRKPKQSSNSHRLERRRFRPVLEMLEDRLAPATLTVNSAADNTTDTSLLTLRDAVILIDHGGDPSSLGQTSMPTGWQNQISGTFGSNDTIILPPIIVVLSQTGDDTVGPSALPVTTAMTIDGGFGAGIFGGGANSNLRLFYVSSTGSLSLNNLILSNARAPGGNGASSQGGGGGGAGLGGAIFNRGTLAVQNSTLSGNMAVGGNGGNSGTGGVGGGGGGLGANASGQNGGIPGGGSGGASNTGGSPGGFGGGGGGYPFGGTFNGNLYQEGSGGFGGGGGGDSGLVGVANFSNSGGFGGGKGGINDYPNIGAGGGGGAGMGGAIFNDGGRVTITNSILSGNVAQGGLAGAPGSKESPASNGYGLGGAIFNHNGALTLVSSNISGNTADQGSEVYNYSDSSSQTATAVINNTITWANPAAIPIGTALGGTQLDATTSVAGTLTYTPASGTVLGVGTHTLLVTLTPSSTALFNYANASVSLTVNLLTPVLSWANPAAITYGTALSATQLDATANVPGLFLYFVKGLPADGTVLQAGANQTLTVLFVPQDLTEYTRVATSVMITVNQATPVLTWTNPANITYGTALSNTQLNATANVPGSFTYTPAAGTVLKPGANQTLSVSFTPQDTTDYTTASTSVTLTVNSATPVLTWANPADIAYGTPLSAAQLDATANVLGIFTYNPPAGTVLLAGPNQTLSVGFTPQDTTDYTSASTSVTITVNQVTPVLTWANPADITYGTALSATQLDATANVPGTFTYTPASGTVLNAGSGQTLSVSFTPTDSTHYTTASKSVTINVAKATPTIDWSNPADITYGTALSSTQLNASSSWTVGGVLGSVAGSFTYTPASSTVLNAGNGQTLSVSFAPTDSTDYTSASKSVTINVAKATPTITWSNPADITYGTALSSTQLNATSSWTVGGGLGSVAGTFTYTPASGTVLKAGNGQTLSVSFAPQDTTDYTTASKSVTINVARATPLLTWANPADITYGTALSSTQLNATSSWTVGGVIGSVAGTFTYTPASGTVLKAGNGQALSVSFTPQDTTDYTTASKMVTINVNPPPLSTTASNFTATAGAPFSGTLATFSSLPDTIDGATAFTAVISWGDGNTSNGVITGSNGSFTVSGNHTYADPNASPGYAVSVQISNPNTQSATVYDTATVTSLGQGVVQGLTGGIGFWHNMNGQVLINSFGSTATGLTLANWLATTFPNLYGPSTGSNNLTGKSNAQVAAYFLALFDLKGTQVQAQVLAVALNVYATSASLGGNAGVAYGFSVSATGLGARTYNVGNDGAAFGVTNNTTQNVYELLLGVNKQAVNGLLYNGNATLQAQAADLFDALNQAGSIG